MAISDVLFDADHEIREYIKDGIGVEAPNRPDPELELALAVMKAVREMPGRDGLPDAPNTFKADLAAALRAYEERSEDLPEEGKPS